MKYTPRNGYRNSKSGPNKIRRAWQLHRNHSRKRGIPFGFEYEEWIAWWEANLGPDWFAKRGRKSGQYVMARKEDRGGYYPDNVECVTSNYNHKVTKHAGKHIGQNDNRPRRSNGQFKKF